MPPIYCLLSKTIKHIYGLGFLVLDDLEYRHLIDTCEDIQDVSESFNQILQPQSAHKTPRIKGLISHCATRFSFVVENQGDAFQRSVTLENCLLLYCTIEGTCTSKIGFDNFPLSLSFIYTRYMWSSFLWFEMFTSISPLRIC